jgi:hypothetical protein
MADNDGPVPITINSGSRVNQPGGGGFLSNYSPLKKLKRKPDSTVGGGGGSSGGSSDSGGESSGSAIPGGSSSASADSGGETIGSFAKGGRVKRTGKYMLHSGERVLNRRQAQSYRRKRSTKRAAK